MSPSSKGFGTLLYLFLFFFSFLYQFVETPKLVG